MKVCIFTDISMMFCANIIASTYVACAYYFKTTYLLTMPWSNALDYSLLYSINLNFFIMLPRME